MIALALICLALCAVIALLVIAQANERQTLLDRIQAPEAVISERISHDAPMLRAVDPNDDEDYWDARKERS